MPRRLGSVRSRLRIDRRTEITSNYKLTEVHTYPTSGTPGTAGDGIAFALVDSSDTDSIFYANCGELQGGNINVELTVE